MTAKNRETSFEMLKAIMTPEMQVIYENIMAHHPENHNNTYERLKVLNDLNLLLSSKGNDDETSLDELKEQYRKLYMENKQHKLDLFDEHWLKIVKNFSYQNGFVDNCHCVEIQSIRRINQ